MGSKGGAPMLPVSPPVVCCICGDYGLSPELFRCKVCLFRSQHKYCSDLYPRAESCRACNWCLREEAGSKFFLTSETAVDHGSGGGGGNRVLSRGEFSPQTNKPVKKQRLGDRTQPPGDCGVPLSPHSGRGRQGFRGKVRRYKLLEEVSS